MEQAEKTLDLLRAENEELVNENKQLMTLNHNLAVELQQYKSGGMTLAQCKSLRQEMSNLKAANKTLASKYITRKEMIDRMRKELRKIAEHVVAARNVLDKCNTEPTPAASAPQVAAEQPVEPDPWQNYLQDVVDMYRKTGRLMGISTMAAVHKVRNITKEQFFQFGLSAKELVTKEDADMVAEKLRNNSR